MSRVRIDGEVEIPKVKLVDWMSRLDELVEILIKIEARQLEILKTLSIGGQITVTREKANRYDVIELDLSSERIDEPIGLKAINRVVSSITWVRVEAPVTYKLNSLGNDPLTAGVGTSHSDWEIEEIYVSNSASAGKKAILYLEWRE